MLRVILSESPHGGGDRALTLHSKGQWFDPRCWQLEKVANLTKVMDSHKNHKVQMTKRLEWTSMSACSAPSPTRLRPI